MNPDWVKMNPGWIKKQIFFDPVRVHFDPPNFDGPGRWSKELIRRLPLKIWIRNPYMGYPKMYVDPAENEAMNHLWAKINESESCIAPTSKVSAGSEYIS
jgi:hypothetical protein